MRRAARVLAALLGVELRAQLPMAVGVGAMAAGVLAFARWSGALHAPLGSEAQTGALLCAAALIAQVVLAVPYDGRGARALWRALQPLPVRTSEAIAARTLAALVCVCAAAAVAAALDLALAPRYALTTEPVADAFFSDAFARATGSFAGLWAGLVLCPLLALGAGAALQHGVGALVLSFAGHALIPALALVATGLGPRGGSIAVVPVLLLVVGVCATAPLTAGLRGLRTRSLFARAALPSAAAFLASAVLPGGGIARAYWLDWMRPEPTFDSPTARLMSSCYALHRGALASIALDDPETWPERSYWVLDCATLEATQVPQSALGPSFLRREFSLQSYQMRHGAWSGIVTDGERGLFALERGADGDWRRLTLAEYDERTRVAPRHGWSFERTDSGETARYSVDGDVVSTFEIGPELRHSRWRAVESAGPHFVLHRDGTVECLDGPSGLRETVPAHVDPATRSLYASPAGRWIVAIDTQRDHALIERATGRSANARGPVPTQPTDRDLPVLSWSAGGGYLLRGLDGTGVRFGAPASAHVYDLDGVRWLAFDDATHGVHVLDANGAILESLRGRRPADDERGPRPAPASKRAVQRRRRRRRRSGRAALAEQSASIDPVQGGARRSFEPRSRRIAVWIGVAHAELRGLLRTAVGFGAAACCGVLWLRFAHASTPPVGSAAQVSILVLLASLLAVPLVATAFAGPAAGRLARTLTVLPASSAGALVARLVGALAATALAWIGPAALDVALGLSLPAGSPSDVGSLAGDARALPLVLGHGLSAVAITALAASVLRSTLGAALLGLCALASTLLVGIESPSSPAGVLDAFLGGTLGLVMPLGGGAFAVVSVALALFASTRLRGVCARSAPARGAAAATALVALVVAVPNGARALDAVLRGVWPAPAFEDADAKIELVRFQHGARIGLFDLCDPGCPIDGGDLDRAIGRSTWAVDADRMTVARVIPPPADGVFRRSFHLWPRTTRTLEFPILGWSGDAGGRHGRGEYGARLAVSGPTVAWERVQGADAQLRFGGPWRRARDGRSLTYLRQDGTTARFGLDERTLRESTAGLFRGIHVARAGGPVRFLDPGTGDERSLGVLAPADLRTLVGSPAGRWLAAEHAGGDWSLLDTQNGIWHGIGAVRWHALVDRDLPLVVRGDKGYRAAGPAGGLDLGVDPRELLYDVDGERWIAFDCRTGAVRILGADGSPIRTLRGPQGGT